MKTKLDEINDRKREHIAARKLTHSLEDIKKRAAGAERPRGFVSALQNNAAPSLIAEVKKASPSKGVIRADFDPVEIAKAYENNGASCLSVLTDEPYFQGHDDYLIAIKEAVSIPLLRKDFMIDEYQIYESRALGADCILLIMAALNDNLAQELNGIARELCMDVLVEIHDQEELQRAKKLEPAMMGVNNRNLKTLTVDINTCRLLEGLIPDTSLKVAESGIEDHATIMALYESGYKAFLVGESLMRQPDIGKATRALLGK